MDPVHNEPGSQLPHEPSNIGYSVIYGDDPAARTTTALDVHTARLVGPGVFNGPIGMPTLLLEQTAAFTGKTPQEMAALAVARIQEHGGYVIGRKPRNDDASVVYLKLPKCAYSLRVWSAFDPATADQLLLDYFDNDQRVPVNQPPGFALWAHPDNAPDVYFDEDGPLKSMASLLGQYFDDAREVVAPQGQDWFIVTGGSFLTLKRDGVADFHFQVPVLPRPHFGQFGRNPYASVSRSASGSSTTRTHL